MKKANANGLHSAQPWNNAILGSLSHVTTTYARTVVALVLAISALAVFYTARHLEFLTSRNQLISSEKR